MGQYVFARFAQNQERASGKPMITISRQWLLRNPEIVARKS
jgi:hypothetical protein